MAANYFEELCKVNVNEKKEQKNNLDYLSWAWAWKEIKLRHPDTTYTVYENADGWNYHTDGSTAWVKVGVTVNGIEHIEYLPVMNYNNKSIPLGNITSFDVNKAIQRATVKAIARHGIGLYIYAGEDLPEDEKGASREPTAEEKAAREDAEKTEKVRKQIIPEKKVIGLKERAENDGVSIMKLCEYAGVSDLAKLNEGQFYEICSKWTKEVIPRCKAE